MPTRVPSKGAARGKRVPFEHLAGQRSRLIMLISYHVEVLIRVLFCFSKIMV